MMFLNMERLSLKSFPKVTPAPTKSRSSRFSEDAWYVELEREKDGVERWDHVSESLARELRKDDLSSFRLVDFACYNRLYKIRTEPPSEKDAHLNSSPASK